MFFYLHAANKFDIWNHKLESINGKFYSFNTDETKELMVLISL